jgi:hypothetical protein
VIHDDLTAAQKKEVIHSHIIMKQKHDAAGNPTKVKARLVAQGNKMDRSLYGEVSSPTAKLESAMMVIGIAAAEERHVAKTDIVAAYPRIEMTGRPVHIRISREEANILIRLRPELARYRLRDGALIMLLLKALYGCIQSARLLFEHVTTTLCKMGFLPNPYDPCVFNRDGGQDGHQCTVCLYVDDLLITCRDQATVTAVIEQITGVYRAVTTSVGKQHEYLGMALDFTKRGVCEVSMDGYIKTVLEGYGGESMVTPALPTLFDIRDDRPLLGATQKQEFHTAVARLLYLAKRVRPDILTAVSFLATRVTAPIDDDMKKLERVLGYIKGTADMKMCLGFDPEMQMSAYVDASYGVHSDRKGHTGGSLCLGKGSFGCKSVKQKIVSKSSTEAELVGVSDYISQVLWARNFLIEQGHPQDPTIIWQDNKSAIQLEMKGVQASERTKHIEIRYFFCQGQGRRRFTQSGIHAYRYNDLRSID